MTKKWKKLIQIDLNKTNDIGKSEESSNEIEEFEATISEIISPEEYRISEKSFSIDSGNEVLHVKATWNPSGTRAIF